MSEKSKKFAWWADGRRLPWHFVSWRHFYQFYTQFHRELHFYDLLVRGTPLNELIKLAEQDVQDLVKLINDRMDRNHPHTFKKYNGWNWYVDYSKRSPFQDDLRDKRLVVARMRKGPWGPTHTIRVVDGKWDMESIAPFVTPSAS